MVSFAHTKQKQVILKKNKRNKQYFIVIVVNYANSFLFYINEKRELQADSRVNLFFFLHLTLCTIS